MASILKGPELYEYIDLLRTERLQSEYKTPENRGQNPWQYCTIRTLGPMRPPSNSTTPLSGQQEASLEALVVSLPGQNRLKNFMNRFGLYLTVARVASSRVGISQTLETLSATVSLPGTSEGQQRLHSVIHSMPISLLSKTMDVILTESGLGTSVTIQFMLIEE